MIKNKTKHIEIHEWADAIAVKINEIDCVRTRYAYNLKDFNAILKNEIIEATELGFEFSISRTGCGKFGGVKWKEIGKLVRA